MSGHRWDLSPEEAITLQAKLYASRVPEDAYPPIKNIGGVDVAYNKDFDTACCAIAVFSYPGLEFGLSAYSQGVVTFDYIPGLLAFREGPFIERAFHHLDIRPEILIFDGHGINHPRSIGIATHMGIILDCATIGCAKTPFFGTYQEPAQGKGSTSPIIFQDHTIGAAVRTREGTKPVYVSQGHKISLKSSVEIILSCSPHYRIPEPIRTAHIKAREYLRNSFS